MKLIPLTKGKFAKVDDEDYDYLMKYKWSYMGGGTNNYAYRKDYTHGKRYSVRMHRVLTNAPMGMDVDHRNRDGLDNRKDNLRITNRTQNNFNTNIRVDNTSGIKGVSWCKRTQSWRVYIGGTKSRQELGYYKDKIAAIAVRKKAELEFIVW